MRRCRRRRARASHHGSPPARNSGWRGGIPSADREPAPPCPSTGHSPSRRRGHAARTRAPSVDLLRSRNNPRAFRCHRLARGVREARFRSSASRSGGRRRPDRRLRGRRRGALPRKGARAHYARWRTQRRRGYLAPSRLRGQAWGARRRRGGPSPGLALRARTERRRPRGRRGPLGPRTGCLNQCDAQTLAVVRSFPR